MLVQKSVADLKHREETPAAGAKPASILIVDDLPEKHVVYKAILDELGQNLVFARSGAEALKHVLHQEFAVILLDVNMPEMNGFETAALIRKRRKSAGTPIIFLTAFAEEMQVAEGYATGAVDYLSTPVMPEILKAKVRVFIELSQMRQQTAFQAEERARREAAEEAVHRSDFLVKVSETLARVRNPRELLDRLLRLPIPLLADACAVGLSEDAKTPGHLEWAWKGMDEDAGAPLRVSSLSATPWLENAVAQVLETRQFQVVDDVRQLPAGFGKPLPATYSVLVLPLSLQERIHGVLILARDQSERGERQGDVSLARSFAIRAGVALENAMLIQKIQEADRRKDEFLAMLAHELRNPLAPISNALQVMQLVDSSDARLREVRDIMQRQVRHMNRLIDDLLDVSRITKGKIELKKETIQLAPVMESAIESSRHLIEQAGHALTVRLPPDPVYLAGDATRLSQVFSNLLNNAAKYMDENGQIFLTADLEGDEARISVRDTGIGIPADMLPKIFDIFMQVDSSIERSRGGLGIGLKLVRELCEMHGGGVTVTSAGEGQGSEFVVRLPVLKGTHATPEKPGEDANPGKASRILVVDDNDASAKTLVWMLEMLGHEARMAHDGPGAITMAHTFLPQVVLLDIGLPGMNGYEVCRQMRADEKLRGAMLVAQTGWGHDEHRKRSREAGFDHHLVKPVDIEALRHLLRDMDPPLQ